MLGLEVVTDRIKFSLVSADALPSLSLICKFATHLISQGQAKVADSLRDSGSVLQVFCHPAMTLFSAAAARVGAFFAADGT